MLENTKAILKSFCDSIPKSLFGVERVNYILSNVGKLNEEEKITLRETFNSFLKYMRDSEASDIEVGGHGNGGYIWLRIHGIKKRANELPQFSTDESAVLISSLLSENQKKFLWENKNLDFSYSYYDEKSKTTNRYRSDAFFDLDTLSLNMRAINQFIRPLETLEFHPNAIRTMSHSYIKTGLSLVTGITGSGKSTTLDSIVDYHNKFDPCHIIIIASPIEFVHQSNIALIKHREVGKDVNSFREGIIQSLRQDPDIIIVGEMRDPETIMAALEITDTGHKVFSTLHTSSAVESIDRIIAEVHPNEQERVRNRLADVLVSVVSQKLVPSLDGKRVLAKEVLIVTPSVRAAIKNNNTSEIYMMINQGGPLGMITLEQDLKRLYLEKRISLETAISYANNKTRINQLLSA
ncbi:MAG: PilT/PilU family type 4a pilus ATPase [Ignavibacterium sp.]|nr:PilT/PilU family type 4a pilus ATPase [Ignavibacterium sp.]MCX7612292.1 PilT/PilU family type 4a pilus ATPase [Ignavibacterium sp.]MDW8374680.1 PilT/PilU family type 4a pilus ATPase [Ignavibacteriales bacterium]